MNIRFYCCALTIALILGGCASRGNEVLRSQDATTVNANIVDGMTTQQEVQSLYGTPVKKHFISEKNEVWTYAWARATAQGQNFIPIVGPLVRGYDVRKKELIVVFNENNVVARHTMTDISDSVKTGLIDPGAATSPAPAATSLPPK
jgi:outer membrane protein assembly factor BamE (lipoprotein component of BamABCDE complex)